MNILDKLILQVSNRANIATVKDIRIGAYWTCVSFLINGEVCAGLSSTLGGTHTEHIDRFPVRDAGQLHTRSVPDLLDLAKSPSLMEASIGLAAINALLEVNVSQCHEINAASIVANRGAGKRVAVIGHFPFITRLRDQVEQLWVLELNPQPGDLPASEASKVLPQADVVAITGTSLLNGTFEDLLAWCTPSTVIIVLGATTPLSPVLFDYGVNVISGTRVIDVDLAMRAVSQGATFRQIPGKRLLTMLAPD